MKKDNSPIEIFINSILAFASINLIEGPIITMKASNKIIITRRGNRRIFSMSQILIANFPSIILDLEQQVTSIKEMIHV